MKVFSIDLETTGLNPAKHGIIEFAAIYADLFDRNVDIKTFHSYLNHEDYCWSDYCLKLHKDWIYNRPANVPIMSMPELINEFWRWCRTECDVELGKSINVIGKNFNAFDAPFLAANGWNRNLFKHRSVDVGTMYMVKGDSVLPSLQECKDRAISGGCQWFNNALVMHNALDDAMDVIRLAWWKLNGQS